MADVDKEDYIVSSLTSSIPSATSIVLCAPHRGNFAQNYQVIAECIQVSSFRFQVSGFKF